MRPFGLKFQYYPKFTIISQNWELKSIMHQIEHIWSKPFWTTKMYLYQVQM